MMRPVSGISLLILIFCSALSAQVPDSLKFKSLPPYDFHLAYLKTTNSILIDVREFFEYKKSRLKDAINIPSSGNLDFTADTLNKESALFLYCTSGFRSKRVAGKFYDKGFGKLYSLEGGINAWKKENMLVDRKRLRLLHRASSQ
jgi:rhodanese-related sulfurtransferase